MSLDPPEKPVIIGAANIKPVEVGTFHKFQCKSFGGNPLTTLQWYRNNKEASYLRSFDENY